MKIEGRSNYKPGPKDECGTPPYAIIPLISHIEHYRLDLGIPRKDFLILEPATGMLTKQHVGIVEGFQSLGYQVFAMHNRDFVNIDLDQLQAESMHRFGKKIRMLVTNPPFSVALKRAFINQCENIYGHLGIPYGLLMGSTTLVEKINGRTLQGCAIHVPHGRICYDMPNKGWGTEEEPTKATFETNWYSKGLTGPFQIWYDDFDMSDHFAAMKRFYTGIIHASYFRQA